MQIILRHLLASCCKLGTIHLRDNGRAQKFFRKGATSTFLLLFSGCWRCSANGRSQNVYPSTPQRIVSMKWQESQKLRFVCNNASFIPAYLHTVYNNVATSVRRGRATVSWPSPQTLKMKKCINSIRQCMLSVFGSV